MPGMGTSLQDLLNSHSTAVKHALETLLPPVSTSESRLFDAMRYSVLGGGKRLRPFLVLVSSEMFRVSRLSALRVAAAVEMVHSYSLVHDDLPAMDNDDLRRGLPATHREFDEATAILTGDALLTRAFEVLSDEETHADPAVRCALISELAGSAGPAGMVGGQMIDLLTEREGPERDSLDVAAITRMHRMKTGRLIGFSCMAGAILGKAPLPIRQALLNFAHDLGLAFQIVDDLLDVEGDPAQMGKSRGKDAASGKVTFVSLMGTERARTQAELLGKQATAHLKVFDQEADPLRQVVRYVLDRRA